MKKNIAYILCTLFGAGYIPLAPGTFASFLTVLALYLLDPSIWVLFMMISVSFLIAIVFTSEIEKKDGKDPKHIVIDEIAGQSLSFLLIPHPSVVILFLGFLFFRLFDINKPFGIKGLQKFKSGLGVVLDDIMAGLFTNIILQLLILAKVL